VERCSGRRQDRTSAMAQTWTWQPQPLRSTVSCHLQIQAAQAKAPPEHSLRRRFCALQLGHSLHRVLPAAALLAPLPSSCLGTASICFVGYYECKELASCSSNTPAEFAPCDGRPDWLMVRHVRPDR